MAHIQLLDQTIRDGQQSLWGVKMQCGMALPVIPDLDRTGFKVIDFTASSAFEVLIRYCQEDPWEGVDLIVGAAPRTPMRAGMRCNACMTFGTSPDALMDIWMRQLNRHGLRSFWIYDTMYNVDKIHRLAKLASAEFGAEVCATVGFTTSPVHTDEYFADITRQLMASEHVHTLLFYDQAGILDVTRMRTLLPGVVAAAGGKQVEFHSNNLLGISGPAYIESIEHGVTVLHTASRPMANAASVPSTEVMAYNLEVLGHTHGIDTRYLPAVADRFERVGHAAGFPVNQFAEYNVQSLLHQIPGGMMGSLKRQLADHRISERLPEVLEEVSRVRAELGYPVMATPLSQLVGTQAVLNILTGVRYGTVPDQVVQYVAEMYGKPLVPVEPNIKDKILSSSRGPDVLAELAAYEEPTEDDLRVQYGTRDDDELILRALVPQADLDKMRAAGPVRRDYPLFNSRQLDEIAQLVGAVSTPYARIATEAYELELGR